MRSRLPAAFVVTVSALAGVGACHDGPTPQANPPGPEPVMNPPGPPSGPGTGLDASAPVVDGGLAGDEAARPNWNPPPTANPPVPWTKEMLNEVEKKTNLTIVKTETGCQVDPGAGTRPGDKYPPARVVKCPATMKDPAWSSCQYSMLMTTGMIGDGGRLQCECINYGNPPMTKVVDCPLTP